MVAGNPLATCYRAACGGWICFLGIEGDRHWPGFCQALERPNWLTDERYVTIKRRRQNLKELIGAIDEVLARRTRAEWAGIFDREGVWWVPVQTPAEVLEDPQTEAAGAFVDIPASNGTTVRSIASPADFERNAAVPSAPVPEIGQHSEEILLELGYDWEQISEFRESGVLP